MGDGNTNSDVDRSEHTENENDGRSVKIDTGYYSVQVWGDTQDSFNEVTDKARAADRAKADVQELDERFDNGDDTEYR